MTAEELLQKIPSLKRKARDFYFFWFLVIVLPVMMFLLGKMQTTKEYVVDRSVYEGVSFLEKQTEQLTENVPQIVKGLDLQKVFKKTASQIGTQQLQAQLKMDSRIYQKLLNQEFGIFTDAQNTHEIYQSLAKSPLSVIKTIIDSVENYFRWVFIGVAFGILFVLLIPPVIMWWFIHKITSAVIECPYCHKVFLSKESKQALCHLISNKK